MRRFFNEMVQRPVSALISAMGLIGQRLPGRQMFDGAVSRLVYGFTRPASSNGSGCVESQGVKGAGCGNCGRTSNGNSE